MPLVLSACLAPVSYSVPAPPGPLTLPAADGRAEVTRLDPYEYTIVRRIKAHGFELRVTRNGRDFDYSEGRVAKLAVQSWCASYNREVNPRALGRFSLPNAWVFDGDCT